MNTQKGSWSVCPTCNGLGKKTQRLRKSLRNRYQIELDLFEKTGSKGTAPLRPKGHQSPCTNCNASGLNPAAEYPLADKENFPHIAIVGGGIGGMALAVACLHRKIPFTLYERDSSFDARSNGYGLTLQQASSAIKGLGIFDLKEGIVSTRHVMHSIDGNVIGEWGMRKWMDLNEEKPVKKTNIHIARQALRLALLEQLGGPNKVHWGHQLVNFKGSEDNGVELNFKVNGALKNIKADFVVGADGIRSYVREILIGEDKTPLRYLGCIVILGICPLEALKGFENPLLDSASVFQTANGKERIYMMPYSSDSIMWQMSFPIAEKEAKELSSKGAVTLKKEACRRAQWHDPIPQILNATLESEISGYPVYDRDLLKKELLGQGKQITLIGDAAHPMSPFKGQGANQALLDALALARAISNGCRPKSQWRTSGIRNTVLSHFETEMLARTASKVIESAEAAKFLHSEVVLREGNEPRRP
ncbi:MAG: FAD-dependent monooxygenase [Flavobacteriaceae bacterium]|nr:FAD-dependent monooxygenase [Flavobacteriaceae bacterium]MDO7603527.1 FAD-dependent monooxygenase [Flavobacteriaceae bacterium]